MVLLAVMTPVVLVLAWIVRALAWIVLANTPGATLDQPGVGQSSWWNELSVGAREIH
jgi:hypothetical protein